MRRALRNGQLRRVLLAYFAFNAAELATWISILVWAYDQGGARASGAIALIQLVPATLVAPFGAVLGDRMRRSHALALGYGLQAAAMAVTALALYLGAPFWLVGVCAALAASAVTLTRPVHNAILPDIVDGPMELTAGNSASGTVDGISGFVGPALGGILLVTWGPAAVFAFTAVTMAAAALVTVGLRVRTVAVPVAHDRMLATAVAGFREVRHDTAAAMLVVLVGAQSVIVGLMDVLVVVLGLDVLGMNQSGPGWLASALGVGAVLGGGATVVLVGRGQLAPALAVGILATGLPIAVLGVASSVIVAVLLLALSGSGIAFTNVAARTLLQRSVSADILARIFGIQEGLMMAGLAIGAVTAPILLHVFGTQGAFVVAGLLLPLIGMAAWTQIRRLDERATTSGPRVAMLAGLQIFAPLPQRDIEQLARGLVDLSIDEGQVVIREGEVGDRFYVIRSGEVVVSQAGRTLRTLGAGDSFGEIALLRAVPRTATVRASSSLQLSAMEREDFLAAVTGTPRSMLVADEVVGRHLDSDRDAED